MTNRVFGSLTSILILLSLVFILRTSLSSGQTTQEDRLAGPLLVWHSWSEEKSAILAQTTAKFEEIHPGIQVILVRHPVDELYARYTRAAVNGFGPDLLIAPGEWLPSLVDGGLVRPVTPVMEAATRRWFLETTQRTLRSQNQLYSLPFSLRTQALYYNKELVTRPATTLDELLAEAGNGAGVGIGSSFESALWGLGSVGGQLYTDQGDVAIDVPGLSNWLTWLRNAQNNSAFVMSTNQDGLRNLFAAGELTYLVDDSDAVDWLATTMQKGTWGVRLLPAGPGGNATPLLHTNALFFSPASSQRQQQAANSLALFLTSKEQQTLLMRRAGLFPTHQDVRINARLNPEISAFSAQAKTAIPWTSAPQLTWLLQAGDETYVQVLEGVMPPSEAAADLAQRFDEQSQQP